MRKLLVTIAALVGLTTASLANPTELARIKQIEPTLYEFIYKHTSYIKGLPLPPVTYVFKDQQTLNTWFYGEPVEAGKNLKVEALYNTGVVFLRDDFTVKEGAFILLHELVHHVQFNHGAKFDCIQEMEREAYQIMDKYVAVSGNGVKTDPMFMMFLNCRPELGWR